jgi:hypothetical protein
VITANELRQMMDRRPVTLREIERAACDAVRHGNSRLDSDEFGRPLTSHDADELRHLGYQVAIEGDGSWAIAW